LKILIIGTSFVGGGRERSLEYKNFLVSKGYIVDLIQFPGENFSLKYWYYYQRALSLLSGHETGHMRKISDKLERRIRTKHYDAVIGVETPWSYVLTKDLDCLKIFSCESLWSEELPSSPKGECSERVRDLREAELEILKKSDYVVFPWKTTENYFREKVWAGKNYITIKYGCHPQNKIPSFSSPISIISLGNLGSSWSNGELLSYLTQISPYTIDVFSSYKPQSKHRLNYKGFAPSLDILTNYQFGLNTISKNVYRQNHFSSRVLTYLSYGLPALSPDWLKFTHDLKGIIQYNENNFLEVVKENSGFEKWGKLSKEAHQQAVDLDWKLTLEPLEKILTSVHK
jgi:hypothetical protein